MYVYILLCSDKSYYTGVTNNLEFRLLQHHKGVILGCYTYSRRPLELVYYEIFDSIVTAIEREKQLKAGSRGRKTDLIRAMNPSFRDLYEKI